MWAGVSRDSGAPAVRIEVAGDKQVVRAGKVMGSFENALPFRLEPV